MGCLVAELQGPRVKAGVRSRYLGITPRLIMLETLFISFSVLFALLPLRYAVID